MNTRTCLVALMLALGAVEPVFAQAEQSFVPVAPPGGAAGSMPGSMPNSMQSVGLGYGRVPPPVAPDVLADPSFNASLQGQFPLSPDQIARAKQLEHDVNHALATPGGGAPTPEITRITMPLGVGGRVPVIHSAMGNITTLIFVDDTGAPWPVTGVFTPANSGIAVNIVGNELMSDAASSGAGHGGSLPNLPIPGTTAQPSTTAAGVDAAQLTKNSSNIVTITPNTSDIVGKNIMVTLEGFNIPMMFTFDAGVGEVDYRLNVTVPADGPNAIIQHAKPDMPSINMAGIQGFVDGVPPAGAQALDVSDPAIQSWLYKGMMYVRTPMADELMSPPPAYHRESTTGQMVYVLNPGPDFVVAFNGAPEQVDVNNLPPAYEYAGQAVASPPDYQQSLNSNASSDVEAGQ